MVTASRLAANRSNAARSTGPRTLAGKLVASANSTRTGVYALQVVVPAIGETAEEFDTFRRAVVVDLAPVGALEEELASRVVLLLWRSRRIAVHEAAVAAPSDLPPDPAAVPPAAGDRSLPLPATATTADRLGRARAALGAARNRRETFRLALGLAVPDGKPAGDGEPIGNGAALAALDAAAAALGWAQGASIDPWVGVLRGLGLRPACPYRLSWTPARVRQVIDRAAGGDPAGVRARAAERLRADGEAAGEAVRRAEADEVALVAALAAERHAAAARGLYGDGSAVERLTKFEAHLSRELAKALDAVARARDARAGGRASPTGETGSGSFRNRTTRN